MIYYLLKHHEVTNISHIFLKKLEEILTKVLRLPYSRISVTLEEDAMQNTRVVIGEITYQFFEPFFHISS